MSKDFCRRRSFKVARAVIIGVGAAFAALQILATAPALAAEKSKKHKGAKSKPAMSAASSEARHQTCLAFIQRHGLSCDPWTEPTCGYNTGFARPPECYDH